MDVSQSKDAFIKEITEKFKVKTEDGKEKSETIDNLLFELQKRIEGHNNEEFLDLLFLLYLDEISKQLYVKSTKTLVDLDKYTNKKQTGYFDVIFKIASLLISSIINHNNWNIILKIDAHNDPFGHSSRYSLVNNNRFNPEDTSIAYPLFFLYGKFCDKKAIQKILNKENIYTVHRDLSEKKTIRSLTYEYHKNELILFTDGINNGSCFKKNISNTLTNDKEGGKKYYLDFLRCVLDPDSSIKKDNKKDNGENLLTVFEEDYKNYCNSIEEDKKKPSIISNTPTSFSFFNLGLSGFESWGTLMIEAFGAEGGTAEEVNNFFFQPLNEKKEEREDSPILNKIKSIVSALKKVDDEYNDALNKVRVKNEAEKSAKAAIMARNMSHNLGSHVMAYLKQHLSSVTNIIQDNVLAELKINEGSITSDSQIESIALPFLVGVGNFVSYLQERQDFIATIATDFIPYFAEVNFKDFIYDELNPDKRVDRHTERTNSLKNDNILLGNIARSEGLGRAIRTTTKDKGRLSDIVLNFRNFDGEPVVDNNGKLLSEDRREAYNSLEEMRKLNVSLPGGVVGRQAIFSIVENIIRNAAKHGNWRNQGRLELTFDFIDKEVIEEFALLKQKELELLDKQKKEGKLNETDQLEYEETIEQLKIKNEDAAPIKIKYAQETKRVFHFSLLEVLWHYYIKAIDAEDLYFVTITDNVITTESAVYKLRDALIEDYIDEQSYKMKEGNKGIKELRISAAWLRGAKNEDEYCKDPATDGIQQTNKKAPLVYVRQHYGCLQYIICLQKPRTIALVTKEKLTLKTQKMTSAENWRSYTVNAFEKEDNKSFNFILCENQAIYNLIRPLASTRTYNIEEIKKEKGIDLMPLFRLDLDKDVCDKIENLLYSLLVDPNRCESIIVEDARATAKVSMDTDKDDSYATKTEDIIVIDDTKTPPKTKKITSFAISGTKILVTDGAGKGHYLYRTHHDGTNEFDAFMKGLKKDDSNYKDCLFVESITGNTSTDRLVRNERFNYKWYFTHLHAMQQKVAIFDERLFAKIYGLEEVNFTKGAIVPDNLEKTKKLFLDAMLGDYEEAIQDCNNTTELNELIINHYKHFDMTKFSISNATTRDRTGLVYYQKGIMLFTFIREISKEKKNVYSLYGIQMHKNDNKFEPIVDEKQYSCLCAKLAELSWNNHSLHIDYSEFEEKGDKNEDIKKWNSKEFLNNSFEYISIHQGLLDKLYEAFGIKEKQDDKIKLTNQFFQLFSSQKYSFRTDGFIPGFIIHSGRSKPGEKDMPQKLPFIQYAAIEHALMDCKYTLVNLLEDARYDNKQ